MSESPRDWYRGQQDVGGGETIKDTERAKEGAGDQSGHHQVDNEESREPLPISVFHDKDHEDDEREKKESCNKHQWKSAKIEAQIQHSRQAAGVWQWHRRRELQTSHLQARQQMQAFQLRMQITKRRRLQPTSKSPTRDRSHRRRQLPGRRQPPPRPRCRVRFPHLRPLRGNTHQQKDSLGQSPRRKRPDIRIEKEIERNPCSWRLKIHLKQSVLEVSKLLNYNVEY